jgi:hypothetical protein
MLTIGLMTNIQGINMLRKNRKCITRLMFANKYRNMYTREKLKNAKWNVA